MPPLAVTAQEQQTVARVGVIASTVLVQTVDVVVETLPLGRILLVCYLGV